MNPRQHCRISVRRWGGVASDYYPIHAFIDSTKALCADGRHRILHTHWAIRNIVVPIFGHTLTNADGKQADVGDLCERDHLLADYGNRFIPTLGDFTSAITVDDDAGLKRAIETLHADFVTGPKVTELMLSPLAATGQLKSLLITHNSWFINTILPQIFGTSPIIENFPLGPPELFNQMRFAAWMDNGLVSAPSAGNLERLRITPELRVVK